MKKRMEDALLENQLSNFPTILAKLAELTDF